MQDPTCAICGRNLPREQPSFVGPNARLHWRCLFGAKDADARLDSWFDAIRDDLRRSQSASEPEKRWRVLVDSEWCLMAVNPYSESRTEHPGIVKVAVARTGMALDLALDNFPDNLVRSKQHPAVEQFPAPAKTLFLQGADKLVELLPVLKGALTSARDTARALGSRSG